MSRQNLDTRWPHHLIASESHWPANEAHDVGSTTPWTADDTDSVEKTFSKGDGASSNYPSTALLRRLNYA
jgi:hypothetical protein